jgi:outer membrane receptor protein involved in Fe transport
MELRYKVVGALLANLALPFGGVALAQSEGGGKKASSRMLEEVVVVAQRREQSINDVPIAVSALSGEKMKNLGIVNPKDLNTVVPGFTSSDGGYGTPVYTLRGVGFNDNSHFATPAVAVYLNEINLPYSIMSKGPTFDMDRLEVLKGPQGTLFGRSSTGGAINFIAKTPSEEFEAGVTASYGRFETVDVEGYVSGPISDTLRYRVAGRTIQRNEGWQYSVTDKNRTIGEKHLTGLRGIFDIDASDDLTFQIILNGWEDTSDAQAGQPTTFLPNNPFANDGFIPGSTAALSSEKVRNYPFIPNTDDPRAAEWCKGDPSCTDIDGNPLDFKVNDSLMQAALKSKWMLGERMEANFLASITKFESDDSQFPTGAQPEKHSELQVTMEMTVIDLEARLSGSSESEDIHWLVGLHATPKDSAEQLLMINYGESASVLFPVNIPLIGDLGISAFGQYFPSPGETEYQSIAPYFNADWQFAEEFKLTVGARYTEEEREYSGCSEAEAGNPIFLVFEAYARLRNPLTTQGAPLLEGGCLTVSPEGNIGRHEETLKEDSFSYRVVLDWTPNDDFLIYLSQSRGFKSGSFPINSASDTRQLAGVKQEQVDAFEVGAKMDFLDGTLHVNTAAFYYDYKDKQLLSRYDDPVFGPLPALANAPESAVQGVEMDFNVIPIDGLYLSGAIAYIETEIKEFIGFDVEGNQADFSGNEFNFSPNLTYSLLADYTIPVGEDYEAGIAVDYSYKGETNSSLDNDPRFAHNDFAFTNARLRFGSADGSWTLTAWGKNITNEYAIDSVSPSVGDVKYRYALMPATYGLSFDYKYF